MFSLVAFDSLVFNYETWPRRFAVFNRSYYNMNWFNINSILSSEKSLFFAHYYQTQLIVRANSQVSSVVQIDHYQLSLLVYQKMFLDFNY